MFMGRKGSYLKRAVGYSLIAIGPLDITLYFIFEAAYPALLPQQSFPFMLAFSLSVLALGIILLVDMLASASQTNKKRSVPLERNCPVCGGFVSLDMVKCPVCESTLLKSCPVCGTLNRLFADRCKGCGRDLGLLSSPE